jgi:hypothetical protein
MKSKNISPKFKSSLDIKSEQYLKNKEMMLEKLEVFGRPSRSC